MKRPIICGGRNFTDRAMLFAELDRLNSTSGPFERVIAGGATGADRMGMEWAQSRSIKETYAFPADWKRYGRGAGPVRNQQMIEEGGADGCIAFPGGRGTADMVRRAKNAGLDVIEVPPSVSA